MKFDTTGIENYANMTAEEKVAAFEAFEFEEPNRAEVTNLKNLLSKRNSEIAEAKRKLSEKRTTEENEEEERKQKYADMESELAELRKQNSLNKFKAQYAGKRGFDDKLANDIAEALVAGELDKVSTIIQTASENAEKLFKAQLLMDAGKEPPAGKGSDKTPSEAEKLAKDIGSAKAAANKRSAEIVAKYVK